MDIVDPLAHLPLGTIHDFRKGSIVYCPNSPSKGLYAILVGNVSVSRVSADAESTLLDIYGPDELFGEACIVGAQPPEIAKAITDVRVMVWTPEEIDTILKIRPALCLALLQMIVKRSADFTERIESHVVNQIEWRVKAMLLRFAAKLGAPIAGGRQLPALTHELMAQYVGTSREITTHYLNHFRRLGLIDYDRKGIRVYDVATGKRAA